MAKRGRKPKERKGYFYDTEEQAIITYITTEDTVQKNRIFNETILPALTKMIESIIRRYKLYVPDEEFTQTFNDTISYLLTKINNFNPEKGTKAYSYCGTVCKNYLIYKNQQFAKKQQRILPYDDMFEELNNSTQYSYDTEEAFYTVAERLIKDTSIEIKKMIRNAGENELNENEIKVGIALCELLDNWESILINDGSNKLQKSSVLYFLREETMMTTKEVRDNMKKYKCVYKLLRKTALE